MQDSIKITQSPFEVELFSTKKQWLIFLCVCILLFVWNMWQEYRQYRIYTAPQETQEIYAQVIAQYTKAKNGKHYEVLKLKTKDGQMLYTTSREDIQNILYRFVRVYGKRLECSFVQYLQSCFFMAYYVALDAKRDYRDNIRAWIDMQHTEPLIASLYKTLFIADFLPQVWRDLSNKLGIAHLIAISGFHLGILSFVIGGFLSLVYRICHPYVSYRNKYFDIGIIVLVCMFMYLLVLDFSPSFLRSFVMAMCGFFIVYSGVKLLSFRLLFVVVCVCIAFFPRLIFSVGFILSVSGVFFIYLFMRYFHAVKSAFAKFVGIPILFNVLIFIDILPLVHWFFPYFTPLCVLCIPLSLLFVVFFPTMLVAHSVGVGFLCDKFLAWAMQLHIVSIDFYTPWWLLGIFLVLCALSMRYKVAYYALHCVGFGLFGFLSWRFYASNLW
ncbi:ComEC/Rec2 family competence protein [Helicobacter jaachi]|nr:ComEC/Rec2 family competence protein [Helicobacter jaachi]